jgi:hypothetical protein
MKIETLIIGLLLPLLIIGCAASTQQPPSSPSGTGPAITITRVPPAGAGHDTWGTIAGEARGVTGQGWTVVIFAYGDTTWYVQPWANAPYTPISADGKWETGTHLGFEYAALLVNPSYKPPTTTHLLPSVGGDVLAVAKASPGQQPTASSNPPPVVRPPVGTARTLRFSGYEWRVKSSRGRVGPGPNYFSDTQENVWVDAQERLHLRITHRDNLWYCAEVISQRSLGYGTYRFYLDSVVDNLNPNVILGLFTWSDDPAYSHREIDIECARWGDANNRTNAQFVVQPYQPAGHLLRFSIPPGTNPSTHSFIWKPDTIFFESMKGDNATAPGERDVIKQWTYSRNTPKPGDENARMNLWLMGGIAPTDGAKTEVIIKRFEFIPLKNPPTTHKIK